MSEVEKIYYNFHHLHDDFQDSDDTKKAYDTLFDYLSNTNKNMEEIIKIEELVLSHSYNCEKQGFVYGFQYAVALLTNGQLLEKCS